MKYWKPACAITIGVLVLGLYSTMIPPTVFWQDAGIYLTGIAVEGNVYPTGFPLYMLLGELWTKIIPIGDITGRIHLFSAFTSAVSSSVFFLLAYSLLKNKNTLYLKKEVLNRENNEYGERFQEYQSWSEGVVTAVAAIITTVLFTLNYNNSAQAINAEVYSLHELMLVSCLYLIVRIGYDGRIERQIYPENKKRILIIALLFGSSLAIHPMAVIFAPVLLFLLRSQKNIFYNPKLIVICVIVTAVAALLPYLYLPITANKHPVLNWGNPNTLERFIKHVTGGNYLTGEQSISFTNYARWGAVGIEFIWEYSWFELAAALGGAIILWKSNKTISLVAELTLVMHVLFASIYIQTTEYNAWLIPSHMIMAIYIGLAINYLGQYISNNLKKKTAGKSAAAIIVLGLVLLTAISNIKSNYIELNRSRYYYAEDFGKNILRQLDQNSIIFMTGDQESSTTMYLQYVKHYRTDIIALKNIDFEELTTKEGRKEIAMRYPTLIIPDIKTENLNEVTGQLIQANLPVRSIYLMSRNTIEFDNEKYAVTPAAAMWKLTPRCTSICDKEQIDLKYWELQYHDRQYMYKKERPLMSLKDPTQPGGTKRVPFIQHMINFELQSWKNLGDWYIGQARCQEATAAYQKMELIEQGITKKLSSIQENISACKNSL